MTFHTLFPSMRDMKRVSHRAHGLFVLVGWVLIGGGAIADSNPASSWKDTGAADEQLTDQAIEKRIQKYRTSQATLLVTDAAGVPLPNLSLTVRQTRHRFLFGCNAFSLEPQDAAEWQTAYQQRFANLFNFATLPFYFGGYYPEESKPRTEEMRLKAKWCRDHGIEVKGHTLLYFLGWPKWLAGRSMPEVEKIEMGRIRRDVHDFAGLIDMWDVINEPLDLMKYPASWSPIAKFAQKLGWNETVQRAFAAARESNSCATLLLNDYHVTEEYAKVVEQAVGAGVTIDAVGLQAHQHSGAWSRKETWDKCQILAACGRPIHVSEITILSGPTDVRRDKSTPWDSTAEGEQLQAKQVCDFYRVLFSHPAVQAITWWDFSDRSTFKTAPAGLLRKDMSPKPAYDALKDLIKKEWWTGSANLVTDATGHVSFRGFLGDYELEATSGHADFKLDTRGAQALTVKLSAAKN